MWKCQFLLGFAACFSASAGAEEPVTFTPEPIVIEQAPVENGWRAWGRASEVRGITAARERVTALTAGTSDDIWIGTDQGRLLSMSGGQWMLQAHLPRLQITAVAPQTSDKIWLSTSDGIRRLDRDNAVWKLTTFRSYYQGHPLFVSGAYVPHEDAERLWGYVDGVYVPCQKQTYAPFVISTEHGLFCWGGYGRVWHHFMPHYWGANSPWLDTRELVPHRRPTCIVEDAEANFWLGTESDGIIRLNSAGRDYHARPSGNNKRDGTEFTRIDSDDVGDEFDTVVSLAAGIERGVWALLARKDNTVFLARFDGSAWQTMHLEWKNGPVNCLAEASPGTVFIGVENHYTKHAIIELEWASRNRRNVSGPKFGVRKMERMTDGRIFAAAPLALYEKEVAP